MNRLVFLVLISALMAGAQTKPPRAKPAPQAPAKSAQKAPAGMSEEEKTLRKLEQDWLTALNQRNAAAVDALLAPDFRDIGVDGLPHTRAQVLALVTDPTRPPLQRMIGRLEVRIFGPHFAVATGLTLVTGENIRLGKIAFTHVWQWRDGRWQVVSSQETLSSE